MKFNTTSVWAAFLVVLSLSVVNAIPVDQAEAAAAVLSADELLTRGDGTFVIPEDAKVEEVPEASKKAVGIETLLHQRSSPSSPIPRPSILRCPFPPVLLPSFHPTSSSSPSSTSLCHPEIHRIRKMSNQTGIKVSPKLANVWKSVTAATSNVRAVKVSIINEALEDDGTFDINGTFEQDFGIVHENLAEKQPSYFLVRLGDGNTSEWIFLCYVPDVAPIRQKMIYAATRASLTKDLGDSHFKDSIYGTNKSDFTLEGYKRHRASLAAPKPLTERERQLAEIHANEKTMVENMKGGAYRKSHAPGMSFPLTDDALAALRKLVITAQPAKPTVVASALPKTFTSPASTPLPASPVITRENTATSSDDMKKAPEANVDEDEWDDDSSKEVKDDSKPAEETKEDSIEAKKEEEVIAPVAEQPESVIKKGRSINFVKLLIDAENERIDLASEDKIPVSALTKNIDEDSPRFTFYAYEHEHKGAAEDSLVFMYTCPTKSKIRERMLYSSCRAGVLTAAKDNAGLNVDKKLETTDVSDLTEAYILDELHPKAQSAFGSTTGVNSPRGFSKPTRPGARRVM